MMRPRTLLIAVAAVVLLGVLAVAALRSVAPAPEGAATGPAAPEAQPPVEPAAAEPAPTVAAVEPPPPWANAGADAPAVEPVAAPDATDARRSAQQAELEKTMAIMLRDAVVRSEASSVHLRKALDTLEAMDDPAVKAQINLEALRHNLGVSDRMQAVASEMIRRIDEPRSPERDQRLEALRREFAVLQGQMRTDVTRNGGALPSAPGPAAR